MPLKRLVPLRPEPRDKRSDRFDLRAEAARRLRSCFPFPERWPLLPGSEGYLHALAERLRAGAFPESPAESS